MESKRDGELRQAYDILLATFGPQHWWPARTREEVIIGAVLTQNTSWKNVEKAIAELRQARCLTLARIHETPADALAELIRSSGTHQVKARRLRNVAALVHEQFAGKLDRLFALGVDAARVALLEVNGVGPETADAILLYAGRLPTFVIDAYTLRVLRRHRWIGPDDGYEEAKRVFERAIPPDGTVYGEYHALLVELGKRHCRKRACCEACPLEGYDHDARR